MGETGTTSRWLPVAPGWTPGPDETAADSAVVISSRPVNHPAPGHTLGGRDSEARRTAPTPLAHTSSHMLVVVVVGTGMNGWDHDYDPMKSDNRHITDSEAQYISNDDVSAGADTQDAAATRYTVLASRPAESGVERGLFIDTESRDVVIGEQADDAYRVTARASISSIGTRDHDAADIHGDAVVAVIHAHPWAVDHIGSRWFSVESISPDSTGVRTFFLADLDDDAADAEEGVGG